MSEAPSLFHERLAAERERLGMSQTDLHTRTGVSKRTQDQYETGGSAPDATYLSKLRDLGFDIAYLFTGRRSLAALAADEQALLAAFTAAPPVLRCAALAVLRCVDD